MTEAKKGRPRGRPHVPATEKKVRNFTFRSRGDMHERLSEAAVLSERSISEEIERRLEKSFEAELRLADVHQFLKSEWGEDVYNIAFSAARSLAAIESYTGKRWVEDERTCDLFQRTLAQLAQNYRDIVLRNARERPVVLRPFDPGNAEQLPEHFADVGGISPPHPRDYDPEKIAAYKKASLDEFKKRIQVSRPLPIEGDYTEGALSQTADIEEEG